MAEYSDSEFKKKLMLLKNTRDAIKSLSAWCIKRHEHYKSIISVWLNAIKKAKIEKRLTLFYLANDVIQTSKKKKYKFVRGWATTIQKTIPYVRDEKIQSKIARIIKIWDKLGVYDNIYLADLNSLLTTPNQQLKPDPVQEFQMNALAVNIRSCVRLEQITDFKMNNLREANLPLTNNEALQKMLKGDRSPSHEFLNELNDDVSKIESFTDCLKLETTHRAQLIDALEVAKSYYAEQNDEFKYVAQAYFYYTEKVKHLQSELQSLVGSMQTDSAIPLSDINDPPLLTSPVSIEKLNVHNINDETLLNPANYMKNFSMKNSIEVPTTVINKIKPYITPDMYTTVQELHDSASVSFPAIENHNQQPLTSQFPYNAPSRSLDKTFACTDFSKQKNVLYTNDNIHDKCSTYSKSSYEVYASSTFSSSQKLTTSELSDNTVPTTPSTLTKENTKLEFHVPQRDWDVTVNSDWSINDTPASPPFHEKIPYQYTSIISKTNEALEIDHCVLEPKIIHKKDRVLQEVLTKTSDIDHRNLISLTDFPPEYSSMVSVDVDYRAFCDTSLPPSTPNFLIEAVSKPPIDNVESFDMNLSEHDAKLKLNHDQKHLVVLPPSLPPQLPFDYDQQCVPDVANQWEHPYQREQEQSDSNFVYNRHQLQHHQHVQSQRDFKPKWKRGICNSPSPKNLIPRSRPTRRWNQGPRFGPRNQPW